MTDDILEDVRDGWYGSKTGYPFWFFESNPGLEGSNVSAPVRAEPRSTGRLASPLRSGRFRTGVSQTP